MVNLKTVPVMCFAYRYVALFTFAVSGAAFPGDMGAAFPGDTGAFATFYTEKERERENNSKSACKLMLSFYFLSIHCCVRD